MSDTRNYRLVYPNSRTDEEEPSDGYVEVHLSHSTHETELNIEAAVTLAKRGYLALQPKRKDVFDGIIRHKIQ